MNSRYKIIECKRGERVSGYPSNLNQLKNYTGLTQLATKFDWSFTPGQIRIRLPGGLIWRAQLKLGNASNQRTVEYCLESNDRICNFGPWPIYIYIDDINRIQKILDGRRGGKFEGAEFFIRGMEIEKRSIRKKWLFVKFSPILASLRHSLFRNE